MMPLLVMLAAPAPAACAYDRAAMMALDEDRFDQDLTGGWRKLSESGCERVAADLIRDWRAANPTAKRRWLSFWHEGQVRALTGQTWQAIALFKRSYRPPADDGIGWNYYVAGSIAFLRRDRGGFDTAYAKLAALPRPADRAPAEVWPLNLDVLAAFRACWGQPYRAAYSGKCRSAR